MFSLVFIILLLGCYILTKDLKRTKSNLSNALFLSIQMCSKLRRSNILLHCDERIQQKMERSIEEMLKSTLA